MFTRNIVAYLCEVTDNGVLDVNTQRKCQTRLKNMVGQTRQLISIYVQSKFYSADIKKDDWCRKFCSDDISSGAIYFFFLFFANQATFTALVSATTLSITALSKMIKCQTALWKLNANAECHFYRVSFLLSVTIMYIMLSPLY